MHRSAPLRLPEAAAAIGSARPVLALAAAFTAAGGYVHLAEWLDTYRGLPSELPGAWVVKVGFPVSSAAAALVSLALLLAAARPTRWLRLYLTTAIALNVSSLGMVIATRTGSVFGWTEPVWTAGAEQVRAVAIGALVCVGAAIALGRWDRPALQLSRQHPS